ncbi:MAG: cytochrome C5, partial [Lactobacillus porci]|nr:cytochrome C5 [Lactobacillus porci]
WIGLGLIIGLTIIGIFIIGRSHHPNRVLSLEFKLKASRKLSMIKALQLLGSTIMFLAAYMRQIVSVNFASAGTTDSLTLIQGVLNSHGTYGQQGSYFLSLFNSLTGGSLWGTYRYATNSSQMMNSSAGTMIILWIFLLMIAPAFCVLSQFFREPYSRHVMTIFSLISAASFMMTPYLMKKWVVQYAIENQMSQIAANNAVQVGGMVFPAIVSAIFVFILAIYREIKRDEF